MEEYILPNLDDYMDYDPTNECYLDGRYFDLVFSEYPGYINSPILIELDVGEDYLNQKTTIHKGFTYKNYDINIIRIIIETPSSRHSGVLIIDMNKKKGYYFDSSSFNNKDIILNILTNNLFFDKPVELIPTNIILEHNPNCDISGYCVAYSIKFVYDYLLNRDFDPSEIRRFVSCIEDKYGALDPVYADIEYGPNDSTLIGAGGGALLGGLLLGPIGLIGGGLLGAGIGSAHGNKNK